jgi:NADP-dependent 3-hydroxy acid dehydrogenase YdfG
LFLFNNAGIAISGEVDACTLDDWNDVFDVNGLIAMKRGSGWSTRLAG